MFESRKRYPDFTSTFIHVYESILQINWEKIHTALFHKGKRKCILQIPTLDYKSKTNNFRIVGEDRPKADFALTETAES
jgi:hypothetical protein